MTIAKKKNRIVAIILSIMIGLAMSPNISFADDQTVAVVGSTPFTTLQAAINAVADGTVKGKVKLTADVTEGVVIPAGKYVVMDLNGHKIANAAGKHTIENKGILKLRSTNGTGTLDNTTHARACIMNNVGGAATVSGDINMIRSVNKSLQSWYIICNEGTMTLNEGVYVEYLGTWSDIQSAVTTGFYSPDAYFPEVPDCKLTVNGAKIKGGMNCIKVDSAGILEMNSGELETVGTNAAIMNWNEATINGGTITAFKGIVLAKYNRPEGQMPSEDIEKGITIINGGDFNCSNTVFTKNTGAGNNGTSTATINGGTFKGVIPARSFLSLATIDVYGGTFDRDVSDNVNLADDRVLVQGEDNIYRVKTFSENDQDKADAVAEMINALPLLIDITLQDESDVAAANDAYKNLTPVQQALISESTIEKLDNAVEKIAKINGTKDLIRDYLDNIDTSKYPEGLQNSFEIELKPNVNARLATMETIEEVQRQYDALKAMKKSLDHIYDLDYSLFDESDKGNLQGIQADKASYVYNAIALDIVYYQEDIFEVIETVTEAFDESTDKILEDKRAADTAKDKIKVLPETKDITLDDKADVRDAARAYDDLTDTQKGRIDNATKAKLDDAVAKIEELETDKAAADAVKKMIEDLPRVKDLTLDDKKDVDAANAAYEVLTDTQKDLVGKSSKDKLDDSLDKISAMEENKAAADAVIAMIKALPDAEHLKLNDKDAVDAADKAYGDLTTAQKKLVDEDTKTKLDGAVAKIKELEESKAAVDAVIAKIDALPGVDDLTLDDKAAVEDAVKAYEALDEGQKVLISDEAKKKLYDAENKIQVLEAEAEAAQKDKDAANAVKDMINALPPVKQLTLDNKEAVQSASDAYDALTDKQKALIENAVREKLENSIDKIKELEDEQAELEKLWDELQTAIANAEKKLNDGKDYTDKSRKALQDAVDAGKALDKSAGADALKDATKKINDAVKDLVEKGNDPNQKGKDGTPIGEGASAAAADNFITTANLDKDPKGSKFAPLKLKSSKQGKKNIKLAWTKSKKAAKYVVYGNLCGWTKKMKKLTTVKGKTFNVKKIKKVALKKGKMYKFIIVALNKENRVVSTSKVIHVATKGGKICNPKKVTVKAKKGKKYKTVKKVTVKKGKYIKLKSTFTKQYKKKKISLHAGVKGARYESSNPKIAKVNSKGVIIGKKKGACTVYVYAQNGLHKAIKVKVK